MTAPVPLSTVSAPLDSTDTEPGTEGRLQPLTTPESLGTALEEPVAVTGAAFERVHEPQAGPGTTRTGSGTGSGGLKLGATPEGPGRALEEAVAFPVALPQEVLVTAEALPEAVQATEPEARPVTARGGSDALQPGATPESTVAMLGRPVALQ